MNKLAEALLESIDIADKLEKKPNTKAVRVEMEEQIQEWESFLQHFTSSLELLKTAHAAYEEMAETEITVGKLLKLAKIGTVVTLTGMFSPGTTEEQLLFLNGRGAVRPPLDTMVDEDVVLRIDTIEFILFGAENSPALTTEQTKALMNLL